MNCWQASVKSRFRYLSLQGTRITDVGLPQISRLAGLKELILSDTGHYGRGPSPSLRIVSKLNNVVLDNTRTTAYGAAPV